MRLLENRLTRRRGQPKNFFRLSPVLPLPAILIGLALAQKPINAQEQGSYEAARWSSQAVHLGGSAREALNQEFARLLKETKSRHYTAVIEGCKDIIRRDGSFSPAYRLLLEVSATKDGPSPTRPAMRETLAFLEDSLRRNPKSSYLFYALGLYYKQLKNYTLASENLERSISLGAPFWDAYEEFLSFYETKADIQKDDAFLRTQVLLQPDNAFLRQAQGVVFFLMSEYASALRSMDLALRGHQGHGDRRAEARCLSWMSYVAAYANDYPRSLELVDRGLGISRESGDKAGEATCLVQKSFIWIDLGNYSQALRSCVKALEILEEIPYRAIENQCLRTLGIVQLELGNTGKARECLESTLAFYEGEHDPRGQDICLYWLTLLHRDRGDFALAMDCAKRALEISRRIGFKTGEAFHLSSIGDLYLCLGNYEKALDFNEQALRVTEEYVSKWSREECLSTIGFVYLEMQEYSRALEYFQKALSYIQRIGHERKVPQCLSNIGYAYFKLGNRQRAYEFYLRSLTLARDSGNKTVRALTCERLGDVLSAGGDEERAKRYYEGALALGREIGRPGIIWEAYSGLGSLFSRRGEIDHAIDAYKNAIEVIEDVRNLIQIREYSSGFFKSKIHLYENLLNLFSQRDRRGGPPGCMEECFGYAERAKARSLLDDLRQASVDPASLPILKTREEEIDRASRQVSELISDLNNPSLPKRERIELLQKLKAAEDEFQGMVDKVKSERSNDFQALAPRPSTAGEIQAALLDPDTALVEYFVGEKNIFIFLLTRAGLIVHRLPSDLSAETLRLTDDYIKLLASKSIDLADCSAPGERLYERLLEPVLSALPSPVHKLIIVPDRNLNYLPFETLSRPGGGSGKESVFLIEDYSISYAPSASTLIQIREKARPSGGQKELLAVGDPIHSGGRIRAGRVAKDEDIVHEYYLERKFVLSDLPFASEEIKAISRRVPKGEKLLLCGEKATENNVKRADLSAFKIIHFATHGLVDEKVAGRSALVLIPTTEPSEDGFFQVREIYQTRLAASLVVLSACQTAKGKMEAGEGVEGISRGFFCAGARSVVASLWNVSDRSSAEFMKRFYRHLREGETKQDALRSTKLEMLHTRYDRPYDWAPFVLIGEADSQVGLRRPSLLERLIFF